MDLVKVIRSAHFCFIALWLGCTPGIAREIVVNGTRYEALDTIAGSFGMKTRWVERGQRLELYSQWTSLVFHKRSRELLLNGERIFLGFAVTESRGKWYLSVLDWNKTLKPLLTPQVFADAAPPLMTIVIDPGHGGKDPGAQNTSQGLKEKELTLAVSLRLKRALEQEGFRVYLTREGDRYIELANRTLLANKARGDLFISVHFNAVADASVEGYETYVYTPQNTPSTSRSSLSKGDRERARANLNDPWNTLVGFYMQRELLAALEGQDRGLRRARFAVLRNLDMPGVLLELGFVTHPPTASRLKTGAYLDAATRAIVKAVRTYQGTLNRISGV